MLSIHNVEWRFVSSSRRFMSSSRRFMSSSRRFMSSSRRIMSSSRRFMSSSRRFMSSSRRFMSSSRRFMSSSRVSFLRVASLYFADSGLISSLNTLLNLTVVYGQRVFFAVCTVLHNVFHNFNLQYSLQHEVVACHLAQNGGKPSQPCGLRIKRSHRTYSESNPFYRLYSKHNRLYSKHNKCFNTVAKSTRNF